MLLNKKALSVASASVASYGVSAICEAFHVSQDVGLGVWAWQNQLVHVHMPRGTTPGHAEFQNFRPQEMFVHAVRSYKVDKCDGERDDRWGHVPSVRYNQTIMTGCGALDQQVPTHDRMEHMNMYDAWNYYLANGTDIPFVKAFEGDWHLHDGVWTPVLHQLSGYEYTKHFQASKNQTSEWKAYTPEDCLPNP
jgi:hypothetical protein